MLDIRELAEELGTLRETDEDPERRRELESLERQLDGDLHVFANHGGTLVEESERKDIAMQAANDQGVDIYEWPYTAIDWNEATDGYFQDWTCIEFEGDTYYTQDVK